jgi:hypothetical protein
MELCAALGITCNRKYDEMADQRRKRPITQAEKELAERVFWRTLPLDDIYISNRLGLGGNPYVTPQLKHDGGWIMHMGTIADFTTLSQESQQSFIHELTHVWQSYHSPYRWGFVANSLCHRFLLLKFGKAYHLQSGKKWREYNVEQQAEIVENWFRLYCLESRWEFEYIRDHIRAGINY